MRRIQALPEGVRNSVRSGVVLYDLTRVVEELVFNSLDAGATKVSVAVGVGTCVVKVADNGSGIDRDGLALLGERFATSKHDHLADLDTTEGNFGFRGEALCSISDVSLLEIISKAHGMPHGYGKVLKSRKCLYLGINDDMHDVGTTVTVRDLFYNQPVRRKHMHSSSKKVLHLAKKCVLRIALVHPRVSFKVFNIESGEEVLGTCSSYSPLTLLSTNFGVDAASALSELKVSEGVLKLSGYISGPRGIMSVQDVQYICTDINSRFVCKGPIHKLLNELAAVCMDGEIHNIRGQIEKPSRCLTCPAFLLNLSCPRSQYDMIFEPMKSSVEFTDWNAVLEFIQGAVTQFWRENISEDFPECCESKRKKSKTLRWSSPVAAPFLQPEKQTEDDICLPPLEKSFSSSELGNGGGCELPKHQKDVFLTGKDDCSSHLYNTSDFDCGEATNKMGSSEELVSGDLYSNTDNYMLNKVTTVDHGSQQEACFLDLKWQNRPFDMDDQMTLSSRSPLCANYHQFSDGAVASQVSTRLCQVYNLKGMSLQDIGQSFTGEVGVRFNNADFDIQRRCSDFGENFDLENRILEESDRRYDIVKPPWLSKCTSRHDKMLKTKSLLLDVTPSIVSGDWANENYLASQSVTHDNTSGCDRLSSTSEWSPRIPGSMYGQDLNTDFVDEDVYLGYGNGTDYNYCQDREGKYCNFNSDPAADCPNVGYSTELLPNGKHNASLPIYFNDVKGHKRNSPLTNCSNILTDEVNWLSTNTSGKSNILNSSNTLICKSEFTQSDRNQFGRNQTENRQAQCQKREVRRSFSAPPICKRPRKSLDLSNLSTIVAEKIDSDDTTSADMSNVKQELPALDEAHSHSPPKESLAADFLCDPRLKNEVLQKKDDIQDVSAYDLKWRKNCQHAMGVMKSQNVGEDEILDISSDMLAYSCDSLVPTSISKTCLRDAKVLQQVDKKFIPVVAGNILAIIDQHAADERIRLEELRKKVLSGEMKQITYLEAEKELVLPEMGYQLLQNYGEQVQSWGWICDINGPGTRSFAKKMNVLHRQHNVAKLVAVPCILGVNLTDTDLFEFLQQLADTDGSSAVPPSVLRILNNKACRGAIMFGDTLLPSECSLIVEELKQTSLCFQCAHGRPTTVPLVNLGILHSQIDRFALRRDGTLKWQGLRRHAISFERAASRLSSAME